MSFLKTLELYVSVCYNLVYNKTKGDFMSYKYISDSHCHSICSFDAKHTVDMMCSRAIDLGLYSVAITDHCEVNGYADPNSSEFGDFSKRIPQSVEDIKQAQKKYGDKIIILRGIELGQPMQDLKSADVALALDDFDFVLCSVHNVRNEQDFYWLKYTKEFAEEILGRYFDEVLQTAKWNKFDSLAHLTYPLRYIIGEHKIDVDLSKFQDVIDEILLTLVKNKKALEVNTSGLRQKIGVTLPDEGIIKRFKELGGEYVTIGSDAHCTDDLGKGIEEGMSLVKKCGFDCYTIFKKHEPQLLEIVSK